MAVILLGFVSLPPETSYKRLGSGQPCTPRSRLRSDPAQKMSQMAELLLI